MEVWKKIKDDAFWFIIIYMIVSWFMEPIQLQFFRDDTDGPDTISQMEPHVDALNGCQYLSVAGGGITPRMDAQGKQICNKK